MSIVITAPTGHIGSKLVQDLLAQNADLTLIARNPTKLSDDVRNRTTVKQGDQTDAAFVREATQGAEALFWLSPPNYTSPSLRDYFATLQTAATEAITANSIPYVVFVSSWGNGSPNLGIVSFSYEMENALNATGANVLSLRCGSFMENFLMQLSVLKSQEAWYGLNSPEATAPYVATQDIAAVAAEKLLHREWQGQLYQAVLGAADLSLTEAASVLSEATGKPLRYVQVPSEAVYQQLLQTGASDDVAKNIVAMYEGFEREQENTEPRTSEATTPTTLAEWSRSVLKPLLWE